MILPESQCAATERIFTAVIYHAGIGATADGVGYNQHPGSSSGSGTVGNRVHGVAAGNRPGRVAG